MILKLYRSKTSNKISKIYLCWLIRNMQIQKLEKSYQLKRKKGHILNFHTFLYFLYRVSIVTFHYNRSDEFLNEYKNANNIKKLLYFLRKIETSDGFRNHDWSHTSYMLKNSTLIPPNSVLMKYLSEEDPAIILNQNINNVSRFIYEVV